MVKFAFMRSWSKAAALWLCRCLSCRALAAIRLSTFYVIRKTPHSALGAFLFLAGCAGSIANLLVYPGSPEIPCCEPDYYRHVQIKYLGAGGYLIRRGDDVLLTAPLFSNPSLFRVGLLLSNSANLAFSLPRSAQRSKEAACVVRAVALTTP
jgi:hypothetical protein